MIVFVNKNVIFTAIVLSIVKIHVFFNWNLKLIHLNRVYMAYTRDYMNCTLHVQPLLWHVICPYIFLLFCSVCLDCNLSRLEFKKNSSQKGDFIVLSMCLFSIKGDFTITSDWSDTDISLSRKYHQLIIQLNLIFKQSRSIVKPINKESIISENRAEKRKPLNRTVYSFDSPVENINNGTTSLLFIE